MKRVVCEACAGTDLVKEGDFFVCQSCGCKYTLHDVQAMIKVDGPVEVHAAEFVTKAGKLLSYNGSALDIVLPDNIIVIGEGCFAKLPITSISGESVVKIEKNAFCDCDKLVSFDFPALIEAFGEAFKSCTSLKQIDLSNVKMLGEGAFLHCTSLKSVSLPNVTTLGESAFACCTSLKSVSLPNATTLGGSAFSSCTSLESVSLPNVTTLGGFAFVQCTSLKSVSLPNVEEVDFGIFEDCTSLESASLPKLTSAGESMFLRCESLKSVSMPALRYVGGDSQIFKGCTQLSELEASDEGIGKLLHRWSDSHLVQTPVGKKLKEKHEKLTKERLREKGLCQHCGSRFEGMLIKRCTHCYRRKDY